MRYIPGYFVELGNQASKQLDEDGVKSVIKSRAICEDKMEQASDKFKYDIQYEMRSARTDFLIK